MIALVRAVLEQTLLDLEQERDRCARKRDGNQQEADEYQREANAWHDRMTDADRRIAAIRDHLSAQPE